MKPVAYVRYEVGIRPTFVPVINGRCDVSEPKLHEFTALFTSDQLRAAKVEVLRDAASHMSIASDYAILWRMADAIEELEK